MRLTILLLLINFNLSGQFRLDVVGDARITRKLDLLSGISNTFIGRRAGKSNTEGSGNSFFLAYKPDCQIQLTM